MTPEQTAAKAFLSSSPASFSINDETRTIAEFYAAGNDTACIAAMNDKPLGVSLNKMVPVAAVDARTVRSAIASGSEFTGMSDTVFNKLDWLMNSDPVQLVASGNVPAIGDQINALLEDSYPNANAKFNELKSRAGSVWESITEVDSAQFSPVDMAEIRAS